jgi:hypothetical protein
MTANWSIVSTGLFGGTVGDADAPIWNGQNPAVDH